MTFMQNNTRIYTVKKVKKWFKDKSILVINRLRHSLGPSSKAESSLVFNLVQAYNIRDRPRSLLDY
jgi:hypothetical protein